MNDYESYKDVSKSILNLELGLNMQNKSSYQKLNKKYNITRAYSGDLECLIMRTGTNEQNAQLEKLRKRYIRLIENLKLN